MRLLHARPDLLSRGDVDRGARWRSEPRDARRRGVARRVDRRRDPRADEWQYLSLRSVSQHPRGNSRRDARGTAMKVFTYERPTDVAAALAAVSRPGAKFISGGTNLLDLMKLQI